MGLRVNAAIKAASKREMVMAEKIIERFILIGTCFLLIILGGGLFYFYFLILLRWVLSEMSSCVLQWSRLAKRQRGALYLPSLG
jgi:cell division septal protein FtsQ